MKPNKALIVSALFIGFLAATWAAITWCPLAMGVQTMAISEYRQGIAIMEFTLALIGVFYLAAVLIHSIKAR